MAQYQENQQTIGKAKNSKVYVAKGAKNSFEVSGKHQIEFPSRDSVMQMKSFFEQTQSDNNSMVKSDQGLPDLNEGMIKDSSEIDINEGQVTKPIRRAGSMLLQPASNVRGPMVKAEYLELNKFNDITVYSGSKKRGMVSVDELDRKIDENSAIAFAVLADNGFIDPDELTCFDSDYVVEFEGAGLTLGRSTLKAGQSQERKKQVTFNCHLDSVFEYPAEPKSPNSLLTQRASDLEASEDCSIDAENALPDTVNGKTLQPYPVCNGSGCLGFYQPRLLEQCSVIQFYGADSFSGCSTIQRSPERTNSLPMEKFKGTAAAVISSCSAEESSWSGGNTGTELLF